LTVLLFSIICTKCESKISHNSTDASLANFVKFGAEHIKKVKGPVQLLMEPHLTSAGCYALCRIAPATRHKWLKWTHPTLAPARQAGTRFTYPRGMEGW